MKTLSIWFCFLIITLIFNACTGKPQLTQYVPKERTKIVYKERVVSTKKITNQELKLSLEEFKFKHSKRLNGNSFALIIGINHYKQNTDVIHADISALSFEKLANVTFGIPKENIITLINEDATSGQVKAKVELIKELSEPNGNIYFFFAGHGVPAKNGFTYLLPSDMSAHSIQFEPSLKLDNIYAKLSKSQAKNVFVFMDSCFSGKDDKGNLLYHDVAPVLRANRTIIPDKKLTLFTAGQATEFANDYKSKKQRLFSYYLIKELSQGQTKLSKIYSNIRKKVKQTSLKKGIGYKQIPQIYGNTNISLY